LTYFLIRSRIFGVFGLLCFGVGKSLRMSDSCYISIYFLRITVTSTSCRCKSLNRLARRRTRTSGLACWEHLSSQGNSRLLKEEGWLGYKRKSQNLIMYFQENTNYMPVPARTSNSISSLNSSSHLTIQPETTSPLKRCRSGPLVIN